MQTPLKTTARPLPSRIPRLTAAEWVMLGAFGVFCFVYPFGTFLLSFDMMPFGMEWMSSLLLAMLGIATGAWLWVNFGRIGGAIGVTIFLLGAALEYIGVSTGFPFGSYRYTGVLVPELPGGVPLAIGFAWLMTVVCGLYTARWVLAPYYKLGMRPPVSLQVCLGALLALGLDLLLEPVAFHIKGYWEWLNVPLGEGYYGVPLSNFVTWFVAALVLGLLISRVIPERRVRWSWLPVVLLGMNTLMFGVVNVLHGFVG